MGKRHDRFQDRLAPGKVVEHGPATVVAVAVIAGLMLVGLAYMLDTPSQTEVPSPRPPASYLAK